MVAVNLSGVLCTARAVVGHLLTEGCAHIMCLTTRMDPCGGQGGMLCGPSKSGHEALIAAMAQEPDGKGVTANVLVPGGARTPT